MMLQTNPANGAPLMAGRMGLSVWDAVSANAAGRVATQFSNYHPGRRLRPSHAAHAPSERVNPTWSHNYTRWGDDRWIPIPMNRGIPFRGDCFGGLHYFAPNVGPTGV